MFRVREALQMEVRYYLLLKQTNKNSTTPLVLLKMTKSCLLDVKSHKRLSNNIVKETLHYQIDKYYHPSRNNIDQP